MSDARIVPYEVFHAYEALERMHKDDGFNLEGIDWKLFAEGWKSSGPASTLLYDGAVVCCGGVVLMGWQRGEMWSLFTSIARKIPLMVFKGTRAIVENTIKEHSLRRVQALVDPHSIRDIKFITRLGFELESMLHSFGPRGEDYLMYWRR